MNIHIYKPQAAEFFMSPSFVILLEETPASLNSGE